MIPIGISSGLRAGPVPVHPRGPADRRGRLGSPRGAAAAAGCSALSAGTARRAGRAAARELGAPGPSGSCSGALARELLFSRRRSTATRSGTRTALVPRRSRAPAHTPAESGARAAVGRSPRSRLPRASERARRLPAAAPRRRAVASAGLRRISRRGRSSGARRRVGAGGGSSIRVSARAARRPPMLVERIRGGLVVYSSSAEHPRGAPAELASADWRRGRFSGSGCCSGRASARGTTPTWRELATPCSWRRHRCSTRPRLSTPRARSARDAATRRAGPLRGGSADRAGRLLGTGRVDRPVASVCVAAQSLAGDRGGASRRPAGAVGARRPPGRRRQEGARLGHVSRPRRRAPPGSAPLTCGRSSGDAVEEPLELLDPALPGVLLDRLEPAGHQPLAQRRRRTARARSRRPPTRDRGPPSGSSARARRSRGCRWRRCTPPARPRPWPPAAAGRSPRAPRSARTRWPG